MEKSTIKLERLSSVASKFGKYMYRILEVPKDIDLSTISGISERDGEQFLWDFSRQGQLEKPFVATFRIRETTNGFYINLVDPNAERLGAIQQELKDAARVSATYADALATHMATARALQMFPQTGVLQNQKPLPKSKQEEPQE